jgi:hypothetical protein
VRVPGTEHCAPDSVCTVAFWDRKRAKGLVGRPAMPAVGVEGGQCEALVLAHALQELKPELFIELMRLVDE